MQLYLAWETGRVRRRRRPAVADETFDLSRRSERARMPVIVVDDADDPRLADYRFLRDAELRRRVEAPEGSGEGIFVAEGALVLRRLLVSDYRVRSVLVTPPQLERLAADLDGVEAPVYVAGQAVMNGVAGFDIHRGVLAAADRRPLPDVTDVLAASSRVVVLERIVDHENLGALFRNAAAFGVDAVLLCPACCDPLYRRSVRVSMGHVLRVPFARVSPWPAGLREVKEAGYRLLALTPDPSARPVDEVVPDPGERLALLLGSEGPGLSEAALGHADERLCIPMAAGVDSLNVATAAAIAFHRLAGSNRDYDD
jgi:tRNA G18 (ribose-2'-O)-methylase SpoU